SALAEALRYMIKRRTALSRFATDARLEADNNIAENAIRCIALGRRNWLFAGSNTGGERAALALRRNCRSPESRPLQNPLSYGCTSLIKFGLTSTQLYANVFPSICN